MGQKVNGAISQQGNKDIHSLTYRLMNLWNYQRIDLLPDS
jgi:hypothetical protein